MDQERDAIRIFLKNLGQAHPDFAFETDACQFRIGGEAWLFSADDFSAEDNFRSHDAFSLGWNMAAATISDILAAGGEPSLYGHTVTIQRDWDSDYMDRFSKGVAHCLKMAGAEFLGGDIGLADRWKYTGIALGKMITGLNRSGAQPGDAIYITGHVGAGNLEAALKIYSGYSALNPLLGLVRVNFPLRMREAALVRKYAKCCIDSSDGVFRALQDLARISRTGFKIAGIPYHRQGALACSLLRKPREILLLGECGEYELVFTVDPRHEKILLDEARERNLDFFKLGEVTTGEELILQAGSMQVNLTGYAIYARNYQDVKEYIGEVTRFLENGKG